jgi:hypothetical protein
VVKHARADLFVAACRYCGTEEQGDVQVGVDD